MQFSAHPLDLVIFIAFLLITLVVGLSYGRQTKTIQDYALGGKNFATPILTATIVATWTSGWVLALILEKVYTEGLYFIIAITGDALALLFIGRFLAGRAGEFLDNVSVAETMGKLYGKRARIITAIAGIAKAIGIVAVQFKVSAKVLGLLFGLQGTSAAFFAAGIVILYSTFGGIRAVTFTDAFQFITFGIFIPVLALVVWNSVKNSINFIGLFTTDPLFSLTELINSPTRWGACLSLMLFFAVSGMGPALFQRISMARNVKQAKNAFTNAFVLYMGIILFMVWLATLIRASRPNIEPGLLLSYVIDRYAYIGLKGGVTAGIMAMVMSTADSYINTASVLFTHDIVGLLHIKSKRPVLVARVFAFSIGVLGLCLALVMNDLLEIALLVASLYIPMITAPLLLALFGFRTSKRVVLAAMAVGFVSMVICRILFKNIDSVIPGLLANLVTLLSSHYLLGEPGGWQKVAPDSPLGIERAARKEARKRRLQTIKNFRLYPYLQQSLPQQEHFYSLLGLYAMVATYSALYTIDPTDVKAYGTIYEGIVHTGLFITTALLTYPIWPPMLRSERFITFFWPLSIGVILFVAGALIVLMSHFHPIQMMVLVINLLIAVLLLQWPLALCLALAGVSLAVWIFRQHTGELLPWSELGSIQFRMIYGLLIFTSLLIALFTHKNAYKQLGKRNEVLTRLDQESKASLLQAAVEHNKALQAVQSSSMAQLLTIAKDLQTIQVTGVESEKLHAIQAALVPVAFQLQGIDARAKDYLRLQITTFPIQSWLETVQEKLREKDITQLVFLQQQRQHSALTGDLAQLTTLLTKSIVALQVQAEEQEKNPTIILALEDTLLSYALPDVAEGYTRQVPALRIAITTKDTLPPLPPSYEPSLASTTPTAPDTPEALEQFANGRIIKAHYGYAAVSTHTLLYVIPTDVKQIRPKDMDKHYMELGVAPERADDHFKNDTVDAQAQEQEFLAAVKQRSKADVSLIKIALELIKWYHGPVKRHTQEPFYLHPLAVAHIVLDYDQDEATLLGALLHDTVEDTSMLIQHIETVFGKETAAVVDLVTHLQSMPGSLYKVKLTAEENLRMLERAGNKRGLYVKLADRMHNIRTIKGHKKVEKRKLIAEETMQFFVPLAERLGLQAAAEELKKQCSEVLA